MPASPAGNTTASAVQPRIDNGRLKQREDGHLDLLRLELLAEIFGRAADHQPGDEHRDDGEGEDAVKPRADAAEDHLAELDVDERHHAAQRQEAVMHRVDRAARGVGRDRGIKRRERRPETHLLALHVAAGLHRARRGVDVEGGEGGIAVRLPTNRRWSRRRGTAAPSRRRSPSPGARRGPCGRAHWSTPRRSRRSRRAATKLVSAFGFSKGCAELALKKPPPLVPRILIASCEATGPCAIICLAPSSVVASI